MARRVVRSFGISLFFFLLTVSMAESAPFAYVPKQGGTTLSVIDAAGNAVITTVDTGSAPLDIDLNLAGTKVYAAIPSTNSVKIIDTAINTVTAKTPVGDVNQNGEVRLSDAIFALQILTGVVLVEPVATTSDVNDDGRIGLAEAMYVLARVALEPSPLNDTGITYGGNYPSGHNTGCTSNIAGAQDCSQGRDATHNNDLDGHAGFSFTKLDTNGNNLPTGATSWSCVRDNVTGLVWEVKTDDGTIHDKDNVYRWGGKTVLGSGFGAYYFSDWDSLVDGSNNAVFCGYNNWRVPTVEELVGLADYGRNNPAIDTAYFPNTQASSFWSASPSSGKESSAWEFDFRNGGNAYDNYTRDCFMYVRLVRSGE